MFRLNHTSYNKYIYNNILCMCIIKTFFLSITQTNGVLIKKSTTIIDNKNY